jgi:hypothetical protein
VTSSNEELLLDPHTAQDLHTLSARLASLVADSFPVARKQLEGDAADRVDAQIVVHNLVAIIARAMLLSDRQLFDGGINAATQIWDLGAREAMYSTPTPAFEASLWEGLGIELYALGGLAVRHEKWEEMRILTVQQPQTTGQETWLRQGQVASTRAAVYEQSFLGLAAARLNALDQELSENQRLEAVGRFDLLSGLIISETDSTRFYPNAAEFSEALVEPLIIEKLRKRDTPLRQHVFAGNDVGLRDALRDYDAKARSQAAIMRYWGRDWQWRGFADGRTWVFLTEGHMLEELPKIG